MTTIPYQTIPNFYKLNIDEVSILKRGWTLNDITKYLTPSDVKLLMMSKNDPSIFLKVYNLDKIIKIEETFNFLPKEDNTIIKSNIKKMKDTAIYLENNNPEFSYKYYSENYILENLKISCIQLKKYFVPDKTCVNLLGIDKEPVKLYLKFKIDDYLKDKIKQHGSIDRLLNEEGSKRIFYYTKEKALKKVKRLKLSLEEFDKLFKPDKSNVNKKGLVIYYYNTRKIGKYLFNYYNTSKKKYNKKRLHKFRYKKKF